VVLETLSYYSGAVRSEIVALGRPDLGFMLTPRMGNRPDLTRVSWCADTGCFSAPELYSDQEYFDFLDARPRNTCVFATAPDVVANAEATWERSKNVLPQIRELGFNAALVAQDGIEHMNIRWESFQAMFIGGSTAWKLGPIAWEVGMEAKRRGKHLHWGRVNSLRRLFMARKARADSADGTYIAFAPDLLLPRVCCWLDKVNAQAVLL
jgi:hypothetical protein